MTTKKLDLDKYSEVAEQTFFRKLGKVVNVVGLTIESVGPDARLGDVCRGLGPACYGGGSGF